MYRKISEELKQSAKLKLNEVESRVEDDVTHIRNWMEKQPHLNFKIDDQLILSFLRCSKFRLERTKEKIDNHYTMKTLMPEFFSNRDPFLPEMQYLLDAGSIIPLPQLDPESGSRVVLLYNNNINPDTCTILDILKLNYIVGDILLKEDDYAVINGIKWVAYCKEVNIKYILQLTPLFVKKLVYISEKGFPFRISGLYLTRCPPALQFLYGLVKSLFSKKIGEMVSMVTEEKLPELLLEKPYILPKELGGNNGSMNDLIVTWKKKVESYKEALLADEKLKTNESLRRVPKTLFDSNSIEGSFRQLAVD